VNPLLPYHRTAQLRPDGRVLVKEIQNDAVIREYDRPMATFSRYDQHRIGVAAVCNREVRL
jgi:hypothetical protein